MAAVRRPIRSGWLNGILWLASFPKSGNTWLRVFIENLFRNTARPAAINDLRIVRYSDGMISLYERIAGRPVAGLSEAAIHDLRHPLQHWLANQSETAMVKTHNALTQWHDKPLIHLEYTAGAVYVVRNPLDVCVSVAHHYNHSIEEAVDFMCSPLQYTPTTRAAVFQVLGTWTEHYRSWFGVENFAPLLLRYEDMLRDPVKSFRRLVRFLGLPRDPARLRRAVRHSAFGELSGQERRAGFQERSRADHVFFRRGGAGGWRRTLSESQAGRIIESHFDLMLELNYVAADGTPKV